MINDTYKEYFYNNFLLSQAELTRHQLYPVSLGI